MSQIGSFPQNGSENKHCVFPPPPSFIPIVFQKLRSQTLAFVEKQGWRACERVGAPEINLPVAATDLLMLDDLKLRGSFFDCKQMPRVTNETTQTNQKVLINRVLESFDKSYDNNDLIWLFILM